MKNDFVDVVFILDESGSMHELAKDVIGGFNSLIENLKKETSDVLVTTVLFNHGYKKIHNRIPLDKMKQMTSKEYMPNGCTALLDAIGKTLEDLSEKYIEERPSKTIMYINTDGMENSSTEFSYTMIHKMISWYQEHENFEINFVAANIDEKEEGRKLGIDPTCCIIYDSASPKGIHQMYGKVEQGILKSMKKFPKKQEEISPDCAGLKNTKRMEEKK